MNIGTLVVSLGIDATGLYGGEVAMARFGKNSMKVVNDLNGSIKQLSMSLRMFGWLATTVLTAPFIMFGKSVFSAFRDYEFTMKKIQALTNSSADEVKNWTTEILKMGEDLARPPQELAEALYFVTSSGIAGAEAMEVLATSAKAASAGLGETQKIADLVTSALNAYRGTGLTAVDVGNYLVAGVREGKAEAEGFATALGSIIPISSKLGLSLDQVVGGMAAITLTGASAANAATYLRNMLQKMIHPSAMSEKMLRKMGSSSAELRNLIQQPNGLMKALGRLKELTDEWGIEALGKAIPNIRGMLAFLSLMGKNMEYNQGIMDRMKKSTNDLDEAFALASTTVKFRMDSAMASLKAGMISFGSSVSTAVLPIIESLAKRFNNMVSWFNSLDESTKRTRITILALAAALGPLSLLFSVFLSGINMAVKVVLGLAEAFTWLRVAMISNPWIAVATGVVAVVGALVHFRKKAIESVEANDKFNKALVEIQGTIKKLKDTSETDFSTMTIAELAYAKTVVQSQYAIAQARLVSSESARKQSGWLENLFGAQRQFDKYQDIEIAKKKQLKLQYDSILKSMDDWGKQWEDNIRVSQMQADFGIEEEEISSIDKAAEAALRLDEAWLQIEKDISNKRFPKIWDLSPQFDLAKKIVDILTPIGPQKFNLKSWKPAEFMPSMKGSFSETGEIMKMYNKELDFINTKEGLLNTTLGMNRDLFDSVRAKVNAASRALEDLMNVTPEEWGETHTLALEQIMANLVKAQDEYDKLEKKKDVYNILANAATDFVLQLGSTIGGMKNGFLDLVDIVLRTGQQIISMYLAIAIAATIAKNAPLPGGLILATVGIGALMALWEGYKSTLDDAAKMSGGGVIPPGYPHDTYPALLSSGERVTPPGKLDDVMAGGVVEFRIKDDYLYGILEKRGRRVNSYS